MNTYRKKNYRNKRNYGGRPRRTVDNYHQPTPPDRELIPLSRHTLTKPDVEAVVEALLSGTLIHGRELERFESLLAKLTHSDHAIALVSGTAALHAALACLKLEPEDEVITSTLNDFGAANMIKLVGAKPILVDCNAESLTLDVEATKAAVTENTKAILANNFGGHPSDMAELRELCVEHNLLLIEDASHGLGGKYRGHYVGNQADITCFSFQPSMAITTCEGGAVTTNNRTIAEWIRQFRNHGLSNEKTNGKQGSSNPAKLQFAGMNYMLSDVLAALGRSQLTRLDRHIERRRSIAQVYQQKLSGTESFSLPFVADWADHAYHLFPVKLHGELAKHRDSLMADLRSQGVDVNVHCVPLHKMPAYEDQASVDKFPNADAFYSNGLCLPLFPDLSYKDIERITDQLLKLFGKYDEKPERVATAESGQDGDSDASNAPDNDSQEKHPLEPSESPVAASGKASRPKSKRKGDKESKSESRESKAAQQEDVSPDPEQAKDDKKSQSDSGRLRKVPKTEEASAEAKETKPAKTTRSRPKRTTRSRSKPKAEEGSKSDPAAEKPKKPRSPRKTASSAKDETKPRTRRPRTRKPKAESQKASAKETKTKAAAVKTDPTPVKTKSDSGEETS